MIPQERLDALKSAFPGKRIAIIGDMMLDCYIIGEVKRISPEAPVPVVEIENEFFRFGGAANCANNIQSLQGVPVPLGVIGNDMYGTVFTSLMQEISLVDDGLIVDPSRPTTAKTRVIALNQHVCRIDKEQKNPVTDETENKILQFLEKEITGLDGIILQDYNKGVMTPRIIAESIRIAQSHGKLITVDPKFSNFFLYKGVTVFKPNRKEAEDVLGFKIRTQEDILRAGRELQEKLEAKYVLLTLGEGGMAVFNNGEIAKILPTKARKVADVSGAGDTVISTLTMALAAGADIIEACILANYAAGIVCGEVGIIPIELNQLFQTVSSGVV
ncbi:D-glycero-beta-D-manno-heptose-7-phosphate kinase [uncultured bacterium]|nr:D-glycero-beta-D-manno-heptose-7-phosphate kinase [uncultured bacterium]